MLIFVDTIATTSNLSSDNILKTLKIHSVEQVSLQKLAVAQSVKKFSAITASTPAPK
jgi:hypothetical protein